MTTSERIAAAIKSILDEDRRADRERIAELERDLAALVVENKRLREDDEPENKPLDVAAMNRVLDECGVAKPGRYDNSTLRIDPDMSDPQPGKLLVVRLDAGDVKDMKNPQERCITVHEEDFVGFLVETPAVEVKRTPKVGDSVRLTVSGWEGETAKIVDVKEQSAALALDEDVKRFSFDCFEVIE